MEEVELLEANPDYALVRHENGRESTVSVKHLAPRGDLELLNPSADQLHESGKNDKNNDLENNSQNIPDLTTPELIEHSSTEMPQLRRSTRPRSQPKYLSDYTEK